SGVFAFDRRQPHVGHVAPRRGRFGCRGVLMIRTSVIASVMVLTVLSVAATAADPRVNVMREQIRALRAQEPVILKAVKERYDLVLKREKLSEAVLRQQRHALKEEENQLLAVAATEEQAAAIRVRY